MRAVNDEAYNDAMYIIAIGWLWVTLMMAITESNLVAGILTFVFYGLLPCLLLLWLLSTSARRSWRAQIEQEQKPEINNQTDNRS